MFETTKLVSGPCKIGAVRSGDCRAGQELTIQRARSRNFSMAGQLTTSQILKLTLQIDAACLPETPAGKKTAWARRIQALLQ
jgi:hypothetical protein